jgi:hypothetical protein
MAFMEVPNKAIMGADGLSKFRAQQVAIQAARLARTYAPRCTAASAARIFPVWGDGWFGVTWEHRYIWFNEAGIRPFTMRSLAGKTIPMWVNDPKGEERKKNPKAKTRRTVDGRIQVLIFRRAAKMGQRKSVYRNIGGRMSKVNVPASYPGAPGRIAVNRSRGIERQGDVDPSVKNPGWIAPSNVGVRWRHPGLDSGRFIARALADAAVANGLIVLDVHYLSRWNSGPFSTYSVLVHQG